MASRKQSWKHEEGMTRVVEVHSYLKSNVDIEFERDGKYLRLHIRHRPKKQAERQPGDPLLLDPLPLDTDGDDD